MPSQFLGIYTAVYPYAPQNDLELALEEGDLLYVLEKSTEDDWWKARKKAASPDQDEPEGLIPNNYVKEVLRIFSFFWLRFHVPLISGVAVVHILSVHFAPSE